MINLTRSELLEVYQSMDNPKGSRDNVLEAMRKAVEAYAKKLSSQEPSWWAIHTKEKSFATNDKDEAKAYIKTKETYAPLVIPLYSHPSPTPQLHSELKVDESNNENQPSILERTKQWIAQNHPAYADWEMEIIASEFNICEPWKEIQYAVTEALEDSWGNFNDIQADELTSVIQDVVAPVGFIFVTLVKDGKRTCVLVPNMAQW